MVEPNEESNSPQQLLRELASESRSLGFDDEPSRYRLYRRAQMLIRGIFGEGSPYLENADHISFWDAYGTLAERKAAWTGGASNLASLLETAAEQLDLFGATAGGEHVSITGAMPTSRKVFVVHGHDEGLKQAVARVLERLDLEVVILHEQPNKGRTIIEKFEDYSDVGFAIVLLTPDDMGFEAIEKPPPAKPRARQNVILELGFFLGRLGRARVVALHTLAEGFELPTDYDGVLFVPVDPGGKWQIDVVTELKAAGIEVDANKLFDK